MSPVFLVLEAALQWFHKALPFPSQPMIIPLQLAIQQLSGIQLSPSSACEQSSRMTLLWSLALLQDCGRTFLPYDDVGLKKEGCQDKAHSCKHPVHQQGVVPVGDTYLNRRHNMFSYFYSYTAPSSPKGLKTTVR